MGKIFLFLRTIRHLKFRQIVYRIFYVFRAKYRRFVRFKLNYNFYRKGKPLRFDTLVPTNTSYASNTFTFLNQSITFSDGIDWDYMDNGKLWAYNLNYFDFLNQENMQKEIGEALIFLFVDQIRELKNANEPYPTSLRGINWIKFFSVHSIEKKSFDRYLYSQYRILLDQIEYHLLGNHLLENGFSLFFGGYSDFLKSENQLAVKDLNLDSQIIEKINKFAPIKYILKSNFEDEQKIIELLDDISRDLMNYDLEFRIQELESKFSVDMSESTFNELKELKKKLF